MSLYLVLGTTDLRAAVSTTCNSFYMPCVRAAFVAYGGSADGLARRLDVACLRERGFIGGLISTRVATLTLGLIVAVISLGLLT